MRTLKKLKKNLISLLNTKIHFNEIRMKETGKALILMFIALSLYVNLGKLVVPQFLRAFSPATVTHYVSNKSISVTMSQLRVQKFFDMDKVLTLRINSNGDSVLAGHKLISYIKQLQGEGYYIICHAKKAFSMGFTILQYCDLRQGTSMSLIMQHMIHTGNGREKMTFDTKEQENTIKFLDRLHGADEDRRLGISYKAFMELYKFGKWYKGKEACEDNVIDSFLDLSSGDIVSCV